jgi:hypothetical protein
MRSIKMAVRRAVWCMPTAVTEEFTVLITVIALIMEAAGSSETSVNIYQTTRRSCLLGSVSSSQLHLWVRSNVFSDFRQKFCVLFYLSHSRLRHPPLFHHPISSHFGQEHNCKAAHYAIFSCPSHPAAMQRPVHSQTVCCMKLSIRCWLHTSWFATFHCHRPNDTLIV